MGSPFDINIGFERPHDDGPIQNLMKAVEALAAQVNDLNSRLKAVEARPDPSAEVGKLSDWANRLTTWLKAPPGT